MPRHMDSPVMFTRAQDDQPESFFENSLNVQLGRLQGLPEPPPFTSSWVFYIIVALCFTVTCGYATVLPSLWPLMQHLNAGHTEYAVAAASFSSGAFCGMLLLGFLADFLPPKPIFILATALSSIGCLMYSVPVGSYIIYPARFMWGIAVGAWPVVLATTRRCSSNALEISKATTVASQAQTLGYIAGLGMAWLASLVRNSLTLYDGVEMQWLLPAALSGILLISCLVSLAVLPCPGQSGPSCTPDVKTPIGSWFVIGLQMAVDCMFTSMLAVMESISPAFTATSYGWTTTQNATFWLVQAILGFGSSAVVTGGLLEKWITTPAHLSLELEHAHEERSNAAYADALGTIMSAISTPVKAVLAVTMTGEKCLNVRLHLMERDMQHVAEELISLPQVLSTCKVVQAAVYSSTVLITTHVILLVCSLMMINHADLEKPVSCGWYISISLVASLAWTPAFVANLVGQQRSVPLGGAGWLFAVQGSLACVCRALAPIWSVPIWHRAGINALFMVISAIYAFSLGFALLILRHHKANAVTKY